MSDWLCVVKAYRYHRKTLLKAPDYLHMLVTTMTEIHQSIELKNFEDKLNQLIDKYHYLIDENSSLRIKQETLAQEKAQLLEKTTLARTRVEAMITRLKAMEHGS
jgi:cell division protein ZapB